jgi:hypothetical protein
MFNRKKLQREKESLEAELIEAHATIRKLRKRLRKRNEHVKSGREGKKARNARGRAKFKYIAHDERKFVYLWIQKVASSSVKVALLPLFDLNPTPFEITLEDGTRHFFVHKVFNSSGYQIGKKQLLAGLDHEYRDYFKFAFVRNPWDRLVSCYVDKVLRKTVPTYMLESAARADVEFYPNMLFAEFVDTVCQIPDRKANGHFRSQHLTVCSPDGVPMADFVGRFENLREDFARVAQEIGAPGLELPERNRKNVSERGSRHYRDFYDERLKNLVHKRFEKDVETFGYSF